MALLEVHGLSVCFGGLVAIDELSTVFNRNEIRGIIGPNGAGKTTLFNSLTGFVKPSSGVIRFEGMSLVGLPTHEIAKKGIVRTFQNVRLFKDLTVRENIMIGFHRRTKTGVFASLLRPGWVAEEEDRVEAETEEILKLLKLTDRADETADALPYGQQRLLEIGRALAVKPKILLLDEPAAGMNPEETSQLVSLLRSIRNMDITIIIIEHNVDMVMNLCELVTVLNFGEKIAEAKPAEIQKNQKVIEAYLGRDN